MSVDDILFAPILGVNKQYMKGEKFPEHLFMFDDPRVMIRFCVDAELVVENNVSLIYPLAELADDGCVVEIIYPDRNRYHLKITQNFMITPYPRSGAVKLPVGPVSIREVWP